MTFFSLEVQRKRPDVGNRSLHPDAPAQLMPRPVLRIWSCTGSRRNENASERESLAITIPSKRIDLILLGRYLCPRTRVISLSFGYWTLSFVL